MAKHSISHRRAPFPVGGVMVLGNDFGCEDNPDPKNPGFIQCLDRGFEDPPTWGIKEALRKAHIPGERCFFTNSYLGLRTRTDPANPSANLHANLLSMKSNDLDGLAESCAVRFSDEHLQTT